MTHGERREKIERSALSVLSVPSPSLQRSGEEESAAISVWPPLVTRGVPGDYLAPEATCERDGDLFFDTGTEKLLNHLF